MKKLSPRLADIKMQEEYKIITFPKVSDSRGSLSFIQHPDSIPFTIKRVFWTYDVPGGEIRGGHAYESQSEVIVALSGSFDIVITAPDGSKKTMLMNRSHYGLFLPSRVWRHIENFSTNAVGLHLSSSLYSEDDYIRDFDYYRSLFR